MSRIETISNNWGSSNVIHNDVSRKLKIAIHCINYSPDLVGCAKYNAELAEWLCSRGHSVSVITAPPYYPEWQIPKGYRGIKWKTEILNGVNIIRSPIFVPKKPSPIMRLLHLASFGASSFFSGLLLPKSARPDVVFAVAPTIFAAPSALALARSAKAKCWLHIQDFEVEAAFGLGILKNNWLSNFALSIENSILKSFDLVSTISPSMLGKLLNKGVSEERSMEFRNWVDIGDELFETNSHTPLRKQFGIPTEALVVLYSGNMAQKQGIELLPQIVALVNQRAPGTFAFLFCGEGPAKKDLVSACKQFNNVTVQPLLPASQLRELLSTADIHLLPQRPEAADLVLPSKLIGMLGSGRPVVAMANKGTGLASEVEGCGFAVDCTPEAVADALLRLSESAEERRALGLAASDRARDRWSKSKILLAFEKRLFDMVAKK